MLRHSPSSVCLTYSLPHHITREDERHPQLGFCTASRVPHSDYCVVRDLPVMPYAAFHKPLCVVVLLYVSRWSGKTLATACATGIQEPGKLADALFGCLDIKYDKDGIALR